MPQDGANPPPSADAHTVQKSELECQKLKREIAELDKPFWRRPALYAVLIPTILGIASLGTGYFTGYFNLQRQQMEIRFDVLRLETAKLESERVALSAQVASERQEFENEKQAMEAQFAADRLRLEEAQHQVVAANETERQRLQGEIARLDAERQQALADTQKAVALLQEEERKRAVVAVESFIDQLMNGDDQANTNHPASKSLISLLMLGDAAQADVVIDRAKEADDPILKGNLLYVLYKATGERAWRDELFGMTRAGGADLPADFWSVFGTSDWPEEELPEVLEFLAEQMQAPGLGAYSKANTLLCFRETYSGKMIHAFKSSENFFAVAEIARDIAFDQTLDAIWRSLGIDAFVSLEPVAFLTLSAVLLAEPTIDGELEQEIRSDVESFSDDLRVTMEELGFPSYPYADLQPWLDQHRKLVDDWTEPGLVTLRAEYPGKG